MSKLDKEFGPRKLGNPRLALGMSLLCVSALTAGTAHGQVSPQTNIEPVSDVVVRFGAGHTDNVFRSLTNARS
ncbi:MAG: hypothetical protein PVF50_12715, partial [Gammaproteobacteria bacterium]